VDFFSPSNLYYHWPQGGGKTHEIDNTPYHGGLRESMTAVDLTSLLTELDARLKNEAHEAALETCDHILSLAPMDTDVLHSKLVCQVELSNAWGAEAGPIHCPANGSLGGSFCRMAPLYSDWLAANARATSFLDRVLVP
jgi:hypothetical protein